MKKFVTFLLSALFAIFSLTFFGCVEEIDPADSSASSSSESVEDSSPSGYGDPFTVTLNTTDGGTLGSLKGIDAIWTDLNGENMYRASFNSEGVATVYGPDGDFQVTLSDTPTGYSYNPNIYTAHNGDEANDVIINLYPLRALPGGSGNEPPDHYRISSTGVYRFEFTRASDEFYFSFGASFSGTMSFQSLLDVTQNEVSPIFYDAGTENYWGNANDGYAYQKAIIGGGAENSYTKNFYYEYGLTSSQSKLFRIGVESINKDAFPISIDVLIEKKGEYSIDGAKLPMVPVPTDLEDFSAVTPEGSFRLLAKDYSNVLDQRWVVYDAEDDRYYVKNSDGTANKDKMLYAVLKKDIDGVISAEGIGLSHPLVRHTCYSSGKDYTNFIKAYFDRCTTDGTYPVTAQLKQYLFDYSDSHDLFMDGKGSAESTYTSDADSIWLFACGYYR